MNKNWIVKTTIMTFFLAMIFSVITESLVRNVSLFFAVLLLLVIIVIGVFFDAIGIAVTAADEKPFHAMASNRIESAKYSIKLIKSASQVANFCSDVVGDIVGIISGSTVGIIVGVIGTNSADGMPGTYFSVLFSGIVAALTVGGKAVGKEIALTKSKEIVNIAGKIICFINQKKKFRKSNKKVK